MYIYGKTRFFDRFHSYQTRIGDCGIACLLSICKFYNIRADRRSLSKLAGTTLSGTTMSGLKIAANEIGLCAEGYEATLAELKILMEPSILHTLMRGRQHFVVCYGFDGYFFKIGDPGFGAGIKKFSPQMLDKIWKTKRLLSFSIP